LGCEIVVLKIRPEAVSPPKPTTLSTPLEPCINVPKCKALKSRSGKLS